MCFFSHPCLDKYDALFADSQNLEHVHMSFELRGSVVPSVDIVVVYCDLKAVVRRHAGNVDKSITSMFCVTLVQHPTHRQSKRATGLSVKQQRHRTKRLYPSMYDD